MLVNIFGKRGAGKTTMIRGSLHQCEGPVVVIDILGNYKQPRNAKGERVSPFYVECENTSQAIDAIASYVRAPKEEKKIIVVQAQDPDVTIDFISATLWEAHQGTLVLDEADGFDLNSAPFFDWLVRYGRNRNVHILTGCRRPAEISRNITAGANRLYAFRTQEPRDIDYFEKTIFGKRAEELMQVEPYSGLFIDYDRLEIGRFRIDELGNVYILNSESIK